MTDHDLCKDEKAMGGSQNRDWDDTEPEKKRKPKHRDEDLDEDYASWKKKDANKREHRKQNQKEKLWEDLTRNKK
jgi:hypothetical protein